MASADVGLPQGFGASEFSLFVSSLKRFKHVSKRFVVFSFCLVFLERAPFLEGFAQLQVLKFSTAVGNFTWVNFCLLLIGWRGLETFAVR